MDLTKKNFKFLFKLDQLKFPNNLLAWISSYLNVRSHRVLFKLYGNSLSCTVRRGVAGYRGGAGAMAWEATAGKLAASAGCFAGIRWLAAGAFAAGAAEAVGEKPLERVLPLNRK